MNRFHKTNQRNSYLLSCLILAALMLGGGQVTAVRADAEFDLQVGLKAPQHVAAGSNLLINLSYSNIGTAESPADTFIQVTLPEGTSFVSAVDQDENPLPPTSSEGNVLTWEIGVLPAGSCCAHIWITAAVAADLPEETLLTTTALISSASEESNITNNQASVTSQVCDMAGSQKEADVERARPGDIVTYTIRLRLAQRQGQEVLSPRTITLVDTLPPATQARFMGWEGATAGTQAGRELRWQGQVGVNSPVTLRYRLGLSGELVPGTQVTNQARIQWSGGELDLEPVVVETYLTDDDHMFGPGGGQWQHAWGLTLEVPQNAVQEMTRFQFRASSDTPPDEAPPGWRFANRALELNAFQFGEINRFNQPLVIRLRYNDQDVAGLFRSSLRLWCRTGPGEPWTMMGTPLQHRNGEIVFTTDHFTEFALFGLDGVRLTLPLVSR
jgi:hypothetical protein